MIIARPRRTERGERLFEAVEQEADARRRNHQDKDEFQRSSR